MYCIGLTGSSEGLQLVLSSPELIKTVYRLTADNQKVIAKDALLVIVNVSAEKIGAEILLKEVNVLCVVRFSNCFYLKKKKNRATYRSQAF